MCAAKIGDKFSGAALEKMRAGLPGYKSPDERAKEAAELARQAAQADRERVEEYIRSNSGKLAREFLNLFIKALRVNHSI